MSPHWAYPSCAGAGADHEFRAIQRATRWRRICHGDRCRGRLVGAAKQPIHVSQDLNGNASEAALQAVHHAARLAYEALYGGAGNATLFELQNRLPSFVFQNMRPLDGGG